MAALTIILTMKMALGTSLILCKRRFRLSGGLASFVFPSKSLAPAIAAIDTTGATANAIHWLGFPVQSNAIGFYTRSVNESSWIRVNAVSFGFLP